MMTDSSGTEKTNSILGIYILISFVGVFYILFLFSLIVLIAGDFIYFITILFTTIGFFLIIILSSLKKDKAHVINPIGLILILIGIILFSSKFLFYDDIKYMICGIMMMIVSLIFLGVVIVIFYVGMIQQKYIEGSTTCENCQGTGKVLKFLSCSCCDGTGIDKRKIDERPMICYYCLNKGTCNSCRGTKLQRKYLLFGTRIKCKKCDGSGICPICKDAPNGGYYLVFWIDDRKGALCRQELWDADAKIKELTKVWEKLRMQNNEILRFEDFVRLPSYNEQEKMPKTEGSVPLYDLILAELIRYEQYLTKFKSA